MMSSEAAIVPGAQVRGTDGVIGTVERLEYAGPDTTGDLSAILVRSQDGGRLYRVPATLLGQVEGAGRAATVMLRTEIADLEEYRIAGQGQDMGVAAAGSASLDRSALESDGTLRIPLAAEEIVFEKQPLTLGKVHVHKGVRTVEEALTVPVDFEEAIIEHLSPDQYDGTAPADPNEIIIPIVEERVVVEKRPVVVEYIRVRKNVVTKQHDIKESVRKVFVEVTQEPQEGIDIEDTPLFRDVTGSTSVAGS